MFSGDFIKFHTVYKDGTELVEEFNMHSEEIISRKVKKFKMTGKEEWFVEIGDAPVVIKKDDDILIQENRNNVLIFFIIADFYQKRFFKGISMAHKKFKLSY